MGKKIIAWVGIIFLLGLYVFSVIAAITTKANATAWFMTAIVATIFVPILMWGMMYFYKKVHKDDYKEEEDE